MKNCKKCNKEFEPTKGLLNFCSLECRNSRTWSDEDKKKKSESAKCSILVRNVNIERLRRSNIIRRVARITRKCPVCGNKFETTTSRNKIYDSNLCWFKVAGGSRSGAGRGKSCTYKNSNFDSTWELEFAKYLDENKIDWIRNTRRFYFNWNNKQTYYIPDFYIPKYNLYVEIKGYWFNDKKLKTLFAASVNNIELLIIENKKYELILNY